MWRDFYQDLHYAARLLAGNPGFACVIILTLAVGIGANTAIFSLLNAIYLRPLPFPEQERLIMVWEDTPMFGIRYSPPAMGNYVEWRNGSGAFAELGALERARARMEGSAEPEIVVGSLVTASLIRALGVQPLLGRAFVEAEDEPGSPKAVLISHSLWQRRFGGDPEAIGRLLSLEGSKHTVIGVMPPGFHFPDHTNEFWVPMGNLYPPEEFSNRGRHNLMVAGRLRPGATLAEANAQVKAISARLEKEYPGTNKNVSAFVTPMREHMVGDSGKLAVLLSTAVCFVLLIACANVANLLLARAVGRRKEFAVRISIGAGRARVARQLAAEHLLLAIFGAAAGALFAVWSFRFTERLVPPALGAAGSLTLDFRVLAFTAVVACFASVLFGLAPLSQMVRLNLTETLKETGDRGGRGRGSRAIQNGLVVVQVALAAVLLLSAGLLLQSLIRLRNADPGFRTENVLTMLTPLSRDYFRDQARVDTYYREVIERITSLPGVVSAGFVTGLPLAFKGNYVGVRVEGHIPGDSVPTVLFRVVTPDYLRTLGIPVLRGRNLTEADGPSAPKVVMVNEAMARKFWPNQEPLGKRFRYSSNKEPVMVVGVVGNVKQLGLDLPSSPTIYLPRQQTGNPPPALAIRTIGDPKAIIEAAKLEIRAVNKDQPITAIATMGEILDQEVSRRKTQSILVASFAICALLLAAVGIYGVLSYFVGQRTREIGVRMAAGARPWDVLRGVLAQSLSLLIAGLIIGIAASAFMARLISHLLFGIGVNDPATLIAIAAVLLAAGLIASWIPARRATRVEPAIALRHE